jgi:hypothetical protein
LFEKLFLALSDYHYSMKIHFKDKEGGVLLTRILPEIMEGLGNVIDTIKTEFQQSKGRKLNRLMYIVLTHKGLKPGVKVGPANLQEETKDIVDRCHEKINSVLESHQTLLSNESLKIFIVVLGSAHMAFIGQERTKARSVIDQIGGGDADEPSSMTQYFLKIPQHPDFDGYCIPVSLILAACVQRGSAAASSTRKGTVQNGYIAKGKLLEKINSTSPKLQKRALNALTSEFNKMTAKYKCLQKSAYSFKMGPILPKLANEYKVNFVIHDLKKSVFCIKN